MRIKRALGNLFLYLAFVTWKTRWYRFYEAMLCAADYFWVEIHLRERGYPADEARRIRKEFMKRIYGEAK